MSNTNKINHDLDCDVVVIGAGVAGLGAGYFLSEQAKVVVLEQEDQPAYHSSGRSAALYIEGYENPVVAGLTAQSGDFFRTQHEGARPLLHDRGGLTIAVEGQERALSKYISIWQPFCPNLRPLTATECRLICPILDDKRLIGGAYDPDWKSIDTHELIQIYLRGLRNNQSTLQAGHVVAALEPRGEGWEVQTSKKTFNARWVVNAAGAWANEVAQLAGLSPIDLTPMRRTAAMIKAPVEASEWPVVHNISGNLYFKPEGTSLMVSPQDETPSPPMDAFPEDLDIAIALDNFSKISDYPVNHVQHSWAGLRTFAPDRLPVVGPDSNSNGFFWLAGQGGFGVQTSPALGKLTADSILNNKPIDQTIHRQRFKRNNREADV